MATYIVYRFLYFVRKCFIYRVQAKQLLLMLFAYSDPYSQFYDSMAVITSLHLATGKSLTSKPVQSLDCI